MNVLMLGYSSKPGSWTIRGEQLGAAIGARVTAQPSEADWRWAEVAYIVKRAALRYAPQAHAHSLPIIWDALDCWIQPGENSHPEGVARQALANQVAAIRPAVAIGATQAMAEALGGAYLPHHSWPDLVPAPPRETVQTVAYQGSAAFLGAWLERLSRACAARGWRFVVNPASLHEADILVAFRDGPWDGWACREWKSGVKLVNAIAAGRPMLRQPSAASREIGAPGSMVETAADLEVGLDIWTSLEARQAAYVKCLEMAPAYRLARVAAQCQELLATVRGSSCLASSR